MVSPKEINWDELEREAAKFGNAKMPWAEWEKEIVIRFYPKYGSPGTVAAVNKERAKRKLKLRTKAMVHRKANELGLRYGE